MCACAGERIPFIQYVVCLAVVAALDAAFAARLGAFKSPADYPFRIKWPNDIHAYSDNGHVKVGGILCQSSAAQGRFSLVVGLGLNVDNEQPTTSVNSVLSRMAGEQGAVCDRLTRGEVLARILNHLEDFITVRNPAAAKRRSSMTHPLIACSAATSRRLAAIASRAS